MSSSILPKDAKILLDECSALLRVAVAAIEISINCRSHEEALSRPRAVLELVDSILYSDTTSSKGAREGLVWIH